MLLHKADWKLFWTGLGLLVLSLVIWVGSVRFGWASGEKPLSLVQNAPNPHVIVQVERPQTSSHEFDPAHPPSDKPADEDGWADWNYQFSTDYDYLTIPSESNLAPGPCTVRVTIQTVSVSISTMIAIYLPKGYTRALAAHENGHAQIAQAVAEKFGPAVAHQIFDQVLNPLIGTFMATKANCNVAEAFADDAMLKFLGGLEELLPDSITAYGKRYQSQYDERTAHGRVSEAENERIAQAIVNQIEHDP